MTSINKIEENKMTAKLGVKMASTILGITQVNIDFIDGVGFRNTGSSSVFSPQKYKISFNLDWLRQSEMLEVLATSFHETRHAYQKLHTDFHPGLKYSEKKETVDSWRTDFLSYQKPGMELKSDYLLQSIEIDAIAFSHYLLKELFKTSTLIPSEVKEEVESMIKEYHYIIPKERTKQ
ncbi:MAG: hypothetical protein KKE16_02865 [Firmicutes bacterium]|nr:hypothetical protein [Bacillota bacterium]